MITKFALLLSMTITSPYSSSPPAVAMTQVAPFNSEAECLVAGNEWIKEQMKLNKKDGRFIFAPRAQCVVQGS